MTYSIAVLNGKGGVGKSALCRTLAFEFTNSQWNTLGLDMDSDQGTFLEWSRRRASNEISPPVNVQVCGTVQQMKKNIDLGVYDVVIVDTPAYASKSTVNIAQAVDMVLIPTRYTADDLRTTVLTVHALTAKGIELRKMAVVFNIVDESPSEKRAALEYLAPCGVTVIEGSVPVKKSLSQALDMGKAVTESSSPAPRKKADEAITNIINLFQALIA